MSNQYKLSVVISGITCDACIKLIKKKIGRIAGVNSVEVTDLSGQTNVVSDVELKTADIANVLSGTPYSVVIEG